MDFHSLARKELQALCKKNKIPANMTNVAMADALAALETVDGVEEILAQTECDAQNSPVRAAAITPRVPRTSVRRKTTKEESESTKLTTKARRGRKESVSDEGKNTVTDTPAATTVARRSRRAVAEGSDQAKEELAQTPTVVSTQRRKAAAARCTRGKVQIGQVKEEEKVEAKGYNTRRSTRLLEKKMEDLTLKDGEASTDSRGKSVETDLENAFNEKPEALAGVEEKNEVSVESKIPLKEVPMESEISTLSVGQDEQGQDEEVFDDTVPDNSVNNSVKRQDDQGTDSTVGESEISTIIVGQDEQGRDEEVVDDTVTDNNVKRQDEQGTESKVGEPSSSVDVKDADFENKYEAFEVTDEGLEDSNDVSLDENSSETGNDTKQSDHRDEGVPVEIDDLASLTSNMNLKEQQHVKEDTKGLATSSPSLEARATEVDQEEDCKTEASDISSIHDFEFASELHADLSEAQKTNGTDVKLECDLPNVDMGMNVKDPDFVASPFTENEIETEVTEMMYSPEKAADGGSKLLEEVGGSKTQAAETDASLVNENAKKMEVSEVATHASESPVDDHASSEGDEENTDQADANEYGAAAELHSVDIIVDNEIVSEEMLFGDVNIESSDNIMVTEALSQSKEASPAKAVLASCESYPLPKDNATPLKQMSNPLAASRKELDHQVASLLLQPTPTKKSSSAQRMFHVFDDNVSSAQKSELEEILVAKSGTLQNKENNVSSAKKPELGTEKIIVANNSTPLEKKSMNYLKKMLKEKLQQEEKARPALQLISGNFPTIQEI